MEAYIGLPYTDYVVLVVFKRLRECIDCVNGHRKQLRVTEYQQNRFLCLAFIDAH